jgi:hypothetical protein
LFFDDLEGHAAPPESGLIGLGLRVAESLIIRAPTVPAEGATDGSCESRVILQVVGVEIGGKNMELVLGKIPEFPEGPAVILPVGPQLGQQGRRGLMKGEVLGIEKRPIEDGQLVEGAGESREMGHVGAPFQAKDGAPHPQPLHLPELPGFVIGDEGIGRSPRPEIDRGGVDELRFGAPFISRLEGLDDSPVGGRLTLAH